MINVLRVGVKSIYDRMGFKDELLVEHGVTESNMMQYLGIIEQRTIEILKMYELCETKGSFDALDDIKGIPP